VSTKVTVTLPDEQVTAARRAVAEGRAASLSAYVSKALTDHGREHTLDWIIADMIAETGDPSAEDTEYVHGQIEAHRLKRRPAPG
jgi:Arc/MetJ-type ribon-helix-helix transcriptional regulator